MKKHIYYIVGLLFGLVCIPSSVFALQPQGPLPPATQQPVISNPNSQIKIQFVNPLKAKSVPEVLIKLFEILIQIGVVVVVMAIIYAGFLFVMAQGNPEQLNKAKSTLLWTIIGAFVLLGAQIIAGVIQTTIKQF